MEQSLLINHATKEDLLESVREVIREELAGIKAPEPVTKFHTRKQVCELLNISLPTLTEYTRSGIIIGKRIGSRILYDEGSVQAALRQMPVVKHKRFLAAVKPLA